MRRAIARGERYFIPKSSRNRFCLEHRKTSPVDPMHYRKYGLPHRAMRARFAPLVAAGKAKCARCGEAIEPGSDWALDHRDDGRGYLGVSHAVCNARAGALKLLGLDGHGPGFVERPYKWSQRWFEDPPVGTTVGLGDGLVEVHVGGGVGETRKAVGES